MKNTSEKELDGLVPLSLIRSIHDGLRSYEGTRLAEPHAENLGEQYPAFWDAEAETFTGPVTTNAIEGGNWRLKHELRTPYARCQGALARTVLVALQDSMYVFRNGGPEMSFAHRVSDFTYEDVKRLR